MLSQIEQAGLFVTQKNYFEAEKIYRNILTKDPKEGLAWLGLGELALLADIAEKAASYFNKACQLLPTELIPLLQLAKAFNLLASEQDALKVLVYAVECFPHDPRAHYHLAQQYILLGHIESALVHLQRVSESQPSILVSYALYELSRIKKGQGQQQQVLSSKILSRLGSKALSEQESIVLCYAMAQIEDSLEHYAEAFNYLQRANQLQLRLCEINTADLHPFYQRIKEVCNSDVLSKRLALSQQNAADVVPLFILGLPRTGSTLLEQCLSKHRNIASAGEAPFMGTSVANALYRVSGKHFPDALAELSTEQMVDVRDTYLTCLSKQRLGKSVVIDKMPSNFQAIGLIYKLFPQAKVINLQRNLPDVAISVYKNYFAENEPYFCDLGEFKQYSLLYTDLMHHWRDRLPGFILDICYEDLVKDTQGTLQVILEFCQLPWDASCLGQTEEGTAVKTLSNMQVRQPIHTKSVGTSHHYAKYLTDFMSEFVDENP
jgi:tetratricopeptide (TPR) repeat protein